MSYHVQQVNWHNSNKILRALREKVFVCEYHIPQNVEFDTLDSLAKHIILTNENDAVIATGRLSDDGLMSRVAVLASHRNQQVYHLVFSYLVEIAKQLGIKQVSFNCILQETERFLNAGFTAQGHVFMEAGIPRLRLSCPVSNFNPEPFTLVH